MLALLVIGGLVALIAGAELVVRYGSLLARRLRVPPMVIGLTIVSIGTSAPELAVGIDAMKVNAGSLAVGNIAGTNIVNLLLILGRSAAIRTIDLEKRTLVLDLPGMAGWHTREVFDGADFPTVSDADTLHLTLNRHGFFWLELSQGDRP